MLKQTAILVILLHFSISVPSESSTGPSKPARSSAGSEASGGDGEASGSPERKANPPPEGPRPKKSVSVTPEIIQSIMAGHNEPRAAVSASNMPMLEWNTTLAAKAQAWTDACKFAHQPPRVRKWGENIAAVRNTRPIATQITAMLKEWVAEKKFNKGGTYEECCSFRANSCCHYTQVIWARSSQVGCGYSECSALNYGGEMMRDIAYLACYYTPPGNNPVVTYDWRPYIPGPETPEPSAPAA